MTKKRFTLKYINEQHISANLYDNKTFIGAIRIGEELIVELLNNLSEENEELKQSVSNLKDTIIKITIAYQRKYDRTIVDLVDEVHDEDITDLIKELQE